MNDDGKYLHLWKKYMPVIRLLLKKSGDQKLQLYRHEFESTGVKNKAGYLFNIEMVNGKVMNRISAVAIAKDLVQCMAETPAINEWLKTQSVNFSMGKSFELNIYKVSADVQEEINPQPDQQTDTSTEKS